MSDISAFPTIRKVLHYGNPGPGGFVAGATIKAGMVLAIHGTGEDYIAWPAIDGTTAAVIGVALHDASAGDPIAIAPPGSIVTVATGTDDAIDAGHWVVVDDNSAGGMVIEMDPAIGSHSATVVDFFVGYTVKNSASNQVDIMIWPGPMMTASA